MNRSALFDVLRSAVGVSLFRVLLPALTLSLALIPAQILAQEPGDSIPDMTGIWQRAAGSLTPVRLTEQGKELSRGTTVFDDPNVRCEGFSIARSGQSSFNPTKIEQHEDHVIIMYEANAGTRKIYFDGTAPSDDTGLSGTSYGNWSQGALSIESGDFGTGNAIMASRVPDSGSIYPLSEEFRMYERYKLVDNDTLDYVSVWVDPEILVWPRVTHATWTRLPDDTIFLPEPCVYEEDEVHYDPAALPNDGG